MKWDWFTDDNGKTGVMTCVERINRLYHDPAMRKPLIVSDFDHNEACNHNKLEIQFMDCKLV